MESGYESWKELAQALEEEWLPEFIKGLTLSRREQRAGELVKKQQRRAVSDLDEVLRNNEVQKAMMRMNLERLIERTEEREMDYHALEKLSKKEQAEIERFNQQIAESEKNTSLLDSEIEMLKKEAEETQQTEARLLDELRTASALLVEEKREFDQISALVEGREMTQEDLSCQLDKDISNAQQEVARLSQSADHITALHTKESQRIPILQEQVKEEEELLQHSALEKSTLTQVLSGLQNQQISVTADISAIIRKTENRARKNLDVLLASDAAAEAVKEKKKEVDLMDRAVQLQMTSVVEAEYTWRCFEKLRLKALNQVAMLMFKMRVFWALKKRVQVKKVTRAHKRELLQQEEQWAKLLMEEIAAEDKVAEEQKKAKAKSKKVRNKKPGKKDGARRKPADKSGIEERLIANISDEVDLDPLPIDSAIHGFILATSSKQGPKPS